MAAAASVALAQVYSEVEGLVIRVLLCACLLVWSGAVSLSAEEERSPWDLDALLQSLSSASAVESEFRESRHRGFRRVPADFRGTMRWDAELGLSLSYSEPRTQVMLIRSDAVFQSQRGRSPRRMPSSEESDFLRAILLDVFRFDRAVWEASFDIVAEFDEDRWSILLNPLEDSEVAGMVERIEISGEADAVRQLEIWRDERSRVEIEIRDSRTVEQWPESVLREAFFRETEDGEEP